MVKREQSATLVPRCVHEQISMTRPSRPSCAWSTPAPVLEKQGITNPRKNNRSPRTRRFRPRAAATPSSRDERTPLTPPAVQEDHIWRNGVMTDSVLEIKWRGEQEIPPSISTALPTTPQPGDLSAACLLSDDDLSASDPYKSFARFTRIAAPTVSLQVPEAPRDLSYSSAAIVQRLLQYAHAKENLERFVGLFSGEFDNYEQIRLERAQGMYPREGGGHEHIHCSIKQIAPDLLFAKYYFNGNSSQVFRSRLYQVNARDDSERGVIEMRIFRFYEETERTLKAANYNIDAIQWDRNDVYDWMQA